MALRLHKLDGWTYLGGKPDAKKPLEVVIRAFDGDVLAAVGAKEDAPDAEPLRVPCGEGRRVSGRHFFVRPAPPEVPCLISYRGI
ncbi:MAG: hypothetical protein ACYTG6_01925 [Planctomycetota bacterium]